MKDIGSSGRAGAKAVAAIIIAAVFTLFVLQNTEVVEITFLLWRLSVSRVLLLVGSLAVGCLAGLLLGWEVFGKKRK